MKLEIFHFQSLSLPPFTVQRELANRLPFLKLGHTISKFGQAGFFDIRPSFCGT